MAKKLQKIAVIGIGYVGLANAVLLAGNNTVYAVDLVKEKVDMINMKKSPLQDKEIEEYLCNKKLNLVATVDFEMAVKNANFVIIATPTDYCVERNSFDTSSVESVIEKTCKTNPKTTIVIKSTIPVGFVNDICAKYQNTTILFSPEFLREGRALYDNLFPSRIIVGYNSESELEKAKSFAKLLQDGAAKKDVPMLFMSTTEAEAVKLFANTYLAMRVAYFNELDTYAEIHGLNAKNIVEGVCYDPRISNQYNNPSFGYGGYCFPKDTKQLYANFRDIPSNLIEAVVKSNKTRKEFIANQVIKKAKNKSKKSVTIGCYRLAMKAGSDNFRYSATQGVIACLKEKGANVVIYEPFIKDADFLGHKIINNLDVFKNQSDIIIANRYDVLLDDVVEKVYTRDIFGKD